MLQVLIVLQALLAAVAREFDRVWKRSHFSYWNTYPKQRARVRGARLRVFMEAGLAAAYLLVSYAARQSKAEFQVQASKYGSPVLPCPRFPRSRPYENDDSLPGWHLDGICVAAYGLHIGLIKA